MSKKSTSTPKIAMSAILIAFAISLFSIPQAASSETRNVAELQAEMQHLQNILEQMDNGTLNRTHNIQLITAGNYSCNETSYEVSRVMTAGAHHLEFRFGGDIAFADNWADNGSATQFVDACGSLTTANAYYTLNASVNSSETCFTILADNITLDGAGFTVNYSQGATGYGVNITSRNNITVKNLNVVNGNSSNLGSYAISANGMSNSTITNNTVDTKGVNGISFTSSNNNNITKNSISAGTTNTFYMYSSTDNLFEENNITSTSSYAIFLSTSSHRNIFRQNTIKNTGSYGQGFYIYQSNNNSFSDNRVNTTVGSNGYGFYLLTISSLNNITRNNITTSNAHGIYLNYAGSNNRIINNTISNYGGYGIFIYHSPSAILSGNNISVNKTAKQQGLFVYATAIDNLRHNIDESNTIGGLPVYYIDGQTRICANNTVYGNGSSYSYLGFVGCSNITIEYSTNNHIMFGATINSTIRHSNTSDTQDGIMLEANANYNTLINNTANNINEYGIYILSSSSNNITNNTANNTLLYGIFIYLSNNNILADNEAAGIYLYSASTNTITGGSTRSISGYDYYLQGAASSNNFTNTKFTASRKIGFNDATSWFNYNNETNGNIWLKTNVSAVSVLTRTLITWSQSQMKWNDTNSTSGITARYNLTGLLPSAIYTVKNTTSAGLSSQILWTDASGNLPSFTVDLNGNTEISVANGISGCGDLSVANTVYTLISNVSSSGTCFNILANNVTLDGNGYWINYSKSSAGYGVNDSGGYDYLAIQNLNIVQGSTLSSSTAIYVTGMSNGNITNNTIRTSGSASPGIGFSNAPASNNNIIRNNTITTTTGVSSYGVDGRGSSNIYIDNIMTASGSSSAFEINSATSTNVTGGSLIATGTGYDYYLASAGTTNNFTNTNFTAARKIYFNDDTSSFNYNNETSGNIWLKTNLTNSSGAFNGASINRTLVTWSQSTMKWNDTNSTSGITAGYILTGLIPNIYYGIYNASAGGITGTYTSTTDSSGSINFTIALNGNTEITLDAWKDTKVNYTTNTNYTKGANTEYNITGNYWRTDLGWPIIGLINITVSNGTMSLSKSCNASSCLKSYSVGPSGELAGGNYSINITAENNSAYFRPNYTQYNIYLEEPAATGTFTTPNKDIYNFVYGVEYSFLHNITLNNTYRASMLNATISNTTLPSKIKSIIPVNNCANRTYPNTACIATFNITTTATADGTATIGWEANWTYNNGSQGRMTGNSLITIQGNPDMSLSLGAINITGNLSESKIFYTNVTNTGNALLTNVGANKPYPAWMEYESTRDNGEGWDGQYWSQLYKNDYHTMKLNITVRNFSTAYYGTTINFTNTQGNLRLINLSITVAPDISASTNNITANYNLSSAPVLQFYINSAGNSPVTNVSVSLLNNTMPAGWVSFASTNGWQNGYWDRINELTSRLLNVSVNVTNFTSAVYTGIILITTNETSNGAILNTSVNLTINVSPRLTVVQSLFKNGSHNNMTSYNLQLNSTGSIKLVNISLSYKNESMPASWVQMSPASVSQILENSYANISINVTVPIFTGPGNYTGKINISSYNVPEDIVNITINVLPDGTWYFTPAYNQTNEFGLGHIGRVANLTIQNIGNIPLNFSLQYGNAGSENCLSFGTGGTCVDYTHLNAPASWESTATDYIFVAKNSTSVLDIWQDNDDSAQHFNIGIKITFTNSSANPSENTTYMFFDIIDQAPSFYDLSTKVNNIAKSYVELNKQITFNTTILDDVDDFGVEGTKGVNDTATYFNVTYPNGTLITINGTFLQDLPYSGDKDTFGASFTPNAVGNYTILAHAVDISATPHHINKTIYFYVYGNTTATVAGSQATTSAISRYSGANVSVPIVINNTGFSTAYYINITSSAGTWWSENKTIGNISDSAQNSTSIIVQVPANTPPGTYPVAINITYSNADSAIMSNSTATGIVVQANETYSVIGLSSGMTFANIGHGKTNQVTFNITGDGNAPASNIFVSTSGTPAGITLLLSKDNSSFNPTTTVTVDNGTTKAMYLNIVVAAGESPGTLNHNFNVHFVKSLLNKDYTGMAADILSDNSWNITYPNNITINGVSGQNTVNENMLIFNKGNVPLNFIFSLAGNVTAFSNLIDTARTVQPQQNYSIKLNYTAPAQNNYFFGNLSIDDSVGPVNYILVHFNSKVFELKIINMTAPAQVMSGNRINFSGELKYGSEYITENTTYSVFVNQTQCPVTNATAVSNRTWVSCSAPAMTDGKTYTLKVQADYNSTEGLVQVINSSHTLYYKDLTAPLVTSKNITSEFEIRTNGTMNLSVSDNVAVGSVTAEIRYPNSTLFRTIVLSNTTASNYSGIIPMPDAIGTYSVTYTVNDTTNNSNSSVTDAFEVYEWKNFTDTLTDLDGNPVSASFIVRSPGTQTTIASFSTNASGFYNATLKRKTYDLEMSFFNVTVSLSDVDFSALPSGFIDVDGPPATQYGYSPASYVVKGFAANTSISAGGNITFKYTSQEAFGRTENNLYIYKCASWDYANRNCNGVITKSSGNALVRNKFSTPRTVTAIGISGFSAYILIEEQVLNQPVMQIPTSTVYVVAEHNTTKQFTIPIQSVGAVDLTNVRFLCESGSACSFAIRAPQPSVIESGVDYDASLNVTIPAYFAPGTYTGTMSITSNPGSVYAQYKTVTLYLTVNEDNNFTYAPNMDAGAIGGGTTGTLGTIQLFNTGNEQSLFALSSNATYLSFSPQEIAIAKNASDLISVQYTAPTAIGYYNETINVSADSAVVRFVPAGMNVTHSVTISAITPYENIMAGQTLRISANAKYLGANITQNVTWEATVDGTACTGTTYAYNATTSLWDVFCTAPNMSAKLSYTLRLKGTFNELSGLFAYDSAYDVNNIYYVDVSPPAVQNITSQAMLSYQNITVNATVSDYSNVTNVDVLIYAPNGTLVSTIRNLTGPNNTYSFAFNFTVVGDYTLKYNLTDELNNTGFDTKFFEIYRTATLAGNVLDAFGSGVKTRFSFYRPGQAFSAAQKLYEMATTSSGQYSDPGVHNRTYDLELYAENTQDKIYFESVDMSRYLADPVDIDMILGNEVQITGTEELRGIALNSSMAASARRITVTYVPDANTKEDNIYLYKCAEWSFSEAKCTGTWEKLARHDSDLDKINNRISANITGFSAYIAAEMTPPIIVTIPAAQTSGGGGGGGGGGDFSGAISDIKAKITSLIEGTSEFSVDAKAISKQLYPGERVSFYLGVRNGLNATSKLTAKAVGEFSNFTSFESDEIVLGSQQSGVFSIEMFVPRDTYPGIYEGRIIVTNNKVDTVVPVSVRVLDSKNLPVSVDIQPITEEVAPGGLARMRLSIYNTGANDVPLNYIVSLVDPVTGIVYAEVKGAKTVSATENLYLNFSVPGNITLEGPTLEGLRKVKTKRYMVRASVSFDAAGHSIKTDSVSFISVTQKASILSASIWGIPLWAILAAAASLAGAEIGRKRYAAWVSSKKKYVETIEFKTLPQATLRSAFVGKIAETDIRAFLDLDTLQTHTIVAGSTGGGKTVAAQIIVEEALLKGVSAIVFDPTAQWSGFLRPNRDKKMLKAYANFDMKVADSRAFNGNIYEITDARQIVDITKHMAPGEITIFTLNQLDTKDIDFFVANTIKRVFHAGLEGSQKLKLLLVYDEVHRLLEKYGGTGDGFLQIERGVREFRKWGVGLVLISQVLSDFVGTIKANIGTEVQVRTRDENDLDRLKMRYGEEIMRSIIKASVGEALLQNSQYNKGKPYFVSFRPLLHATDRLSDEELGRYSKYNGKIEELKYQVECLKSEAIDVFDAELELKLTSENLMKGKFNMVEIYLEELEPKVAATWKKLGREPKRRVVEYATREEIQEEVERAKKERADYMLLQKVAEEKTRKEAASSAQKAPEAKADGAAGGKTAAPKHGKHEIESIRSAVTRGMRGRAANPKKGPAASSVVQEGEGVKKLYEYLKEKIAEQKRNGKDVSLADIKSMSIPSDIKLAIADEDRDKLEKIREKISRLLKNI